MQQKKNGTNNYWKWACLTLLAFMLGFIFVVTNRVLTPRENQTILVKTNSEDFKLGSFSTNREQLNTTIAHYLEDYQIKDFTYKLYATSQQVVFEGSYNILGVTIPLYIYFQPSKLADGSILLTISEISAGTLSFPKAEVLTYLQKNYKLPEFVKIDPTEAKVQIQLPALDNSLGFYAKANTIDLYNDQIIVDIYRKQ